VSDVRSESATTPKRIFQYFFISYYFVEEFYYYLEFLFFVFLFPRGVRGECPKFKTPYSLQIKGKKEGV